MRALDQIVPVCLQVPKDITSSGIDRVAWSMRGYEHALIRLLVGNIAADMTLVFQQDKNTTITTADKALNFTKYFRKSGVNAAYEEVVVASGNTLVLAHATSDNKEYMWEISAGQLEANGNYDTIALSAPAPGGACVVALEVFLFRSRRGMGNRGSYFDSLSERLAP